MSDISSFQADQNNGRSKIKFISSDRAFFQPMYRDDRCVARDKFSYESDGTFVDKQMKVSDVSAQFTRNNKTSFALDSTTDSTFDDKFFPGLTKMSNSSRERNGLTPEEASKFIARCDMGTPHTKVDVSAPSSKQEHVGQTVFNPYLNDPFRCAEPSSADFKYDNISQIQFPPSSRNKYYDSSDYVNNGRKIDGGFGNLDRFAQHKVGIATRNQEERVRDGEIDRTHFTFRKYQDAVYGSNPKPKTTRTRNKDFNVTRSYK